MDFYHCQNLGYFCLEYFIKYIHNFVFRNIFIYMVFSVDLLRENAKLLTDLCAFLKIFVKKSGIFKKFIFIITILYLYIVLFRCSQKL